MTIERIQNRLLQERADLRWQFKSLAIQAERRGDKRVLEPATAFATAIDAVNAAIQLLENLKWH